jgi:hypothetical protein
MHYYYLLLINRIEIRDENEYLNHYSDRVSGYYPNNRIIYSINVLNATISDITCHCFASNSRLGTIKKIVMMDEKNKETKQIYSRLLS